MTLLKELLQDQQAGLTVYLPDCAQSRLWGNLDHKIHEATGFQIVARQWINHDINSILRFYHNPGDEPESEQDPVEAVHKYDNIPAEKLQYGHLMVKLLMMGPSLVTIWQGKDAIPTLLSLKGKTQPAEAAANSIRGGFWCDNGVCNLIHTSDDMFEVERELIALKLEHWLGDEAAQVRLFQPGPMPDRYVAHSGISVVSDVVNRILVASNIAPKVFHIPPSGNAKETNQQLTTQLREIAAHHAETTSFIDSFLAGDIITLTGMLRSMPVTRWEHFVIQCGAINRERWNV